MWTKERKIQDEIDIANATSVFASGLNIKGDIEAVNDIRIEGRIIGNVTTRMKLIVGVTGTIAGNVKAGETCIMGEVTGDFMVYGLARFTSTAKVLGNIVSKKVEIEAGADMEVNLTKIHPEEKLDDNLFNLKMVKFSRKPHIGPLFLAKIKGMREMLKEQ